MPHPHARRFSIPLSIWLSLLGFIAAGFYLVDVNRADPLHPPFRQPANKPEEYGIAGEGIIEGRNGNFTPQPIRPGRVKSVYVKAGDTVAKGQALYKMDVPELQALLSEANADLKASKEAYLHAKNDEPDLPQQRKPGSHQLNALKAQVAARQAKIRELQIQQSQSIIHAPAAGEILSVNVRPGSFLSCSSMELPPLSLAASGSKQVRVDVDEVNTGSIRPGMAAIAYLKGQTAHSFPLLFDHIEPVMHPKSNLNGSSTERVDVRVLQVIYTFKTTPFPVYVGQQVDVYLKER